MTNKSEFIKLTIIAWLVFFAGLGVEMLVDYLLRSQDGNIRTGGIPETLWFLMQIFLGAVSVWLAFLGTSSLVRLWKRLLVLAVELLVGFAVYIFMVLFYVVGMGIDSL